MAYAAKLLATLARSVVSVSNKLSIAAVLGLATLPVLPHDAASGVGAKEALPAPAPIAVVHAKPIPITESAPIDPAFQLAARRSRVKREPPPEAEERAPQEATSPNATKETANSAQAPSHKTSSISQPEPEKTPLPPSAEPKSPEAAQAEPPKPDVWSDAQVIAALRECVRLLAPIAADVEVSEPVKHEQCGAPAPVAVKRIGSGANKVEISPPAVLNCAMVVGLHAWVEKTLQPAALEALGSPVTRLRNLSGYACRNRIGSQFHSDRLSEHALANAVDIAGFVTADGRSIEVARHWGPTARDQREAEKVTAARAKDAASPADKGGPPKSERAVNRKISAIAHAAVEPAKGKKTATSVKTAELQRPAKSTSDISTDPRAIPATPAPGREAAAKSAEAQFLRRLHKGACGVFGTVLGPEANEAHRDHFHFDLAHRRNSAYCQ
jgi:hypothetical protein